jgi:hypothetical protein
MPEQYRRAHRGRRQLKVLMPDRFREQQERPGHRYKRWAEGLLYPIGVASKTRCVLSFAAHVGMRSVVWIETAFESSDGWPSTWRVAKASKDGIKMMAGVEDARKSGVRCDL